MKQYDLATALNSLTDVVATNDNIAKCFESCIIVVGEEKLTASKWHWQLDELKKAIQPLPRSFTKRYTDTKFECVWTLAPNVELILHCDRDNVCKKTVSWDCEDAESVLKDLEPSEGLVSEVL